LFHSIYIFFIVVIIFVTLIPLMTSQPSPITNIYLQETIQTLEEKIIEFERNIKKCIEIMEDAIKDHEVQS
jgi:uncharacterized protein YybS (DUF2232 family)